MPPKRRHVDSGNVEYHAEKADRTNSTFGFADIQASTENQRSYFLPTLDKTLIEICAKKRYFTKQS